MYATLLLPIVLCAASRGDTPTSRDVVTLVDGSTVEGRVVLDADDRVICRTDATQRSIERRLVREVRSRERSLAEYLTRLDESNDQDVAGWKDLGEFAASRGLEDEARSAWLRVVRANPVDEVAWSRLGARQVRGAWRLALDGRELGHAELFSDHADRRQTVAWSSAHFLISSDRGLGAALDAAVDAEVLYTQFYEVVGRRLSLQVFDGRPAIHLHADSKGYPTPPIAGQTAWFQPLANAVHIRVDPTSDRAEIVGEFVDLLAHNAFRRSTDDRFGVLEPWFREGLRQVFVGAVQPDAGRLRFDFRSPRVDLFDLAQRDAQQLSLSELLASARGSFDSGRSSARATAAAYTLLHFLLEGDSGRRRGKFADYLRDAYEGRAGVSRLLQHLGESEEAVERAWRAHVTVMSSPGRPGARRP